MSLSNWLLVGLGVYWNIWFIALSMANRRRKKDIDELGVVIRKRMAPPRPQPHTPIIPRQYRRHEEDEL